MDFALAPGRWCQMSKFKKKQLKDSKIFAFRERTGWIMEGTSVLQAFIAICLLSYVHALF